MSGLARQLTSEEFRSLLMRFADGLTGAEFAAIESAGRSSLTDAHRAYLQEAAKRLPGAISWTYRGGLPNVDPCLSELYMDALGEEGRAIRRESYAMLDG